MNNLSAANQATPQDAPAAEDDQTLAEDEMDEALDDTAAEPPPEKAAILVLGQGDFESNQANRGADDPGDNTLNAPQFLWKYGEMIFVSDRGNHRVLAWNTTPQENGEPAGIVLGQDDFSEFLENRGYTAKLDEMTSGLGDESLDGFMISRAEEDTLSAPAGICVIDGKLYIADSGNHRVLRWETLPSDNGEAPGLVLGQDNLDSCDANRRGLLGSGSLFYPTGICSGDDQHVFVADKDNHRILIWNKIPFNNGWNADMALGQAAMDERMANRGEFEKCGPDTLSFPTGVWYDAATDHLFVVDQGNHRVLIWNKLPNKIGQPADVVLGQKDFYSREVNAGLGHRRATSETLYFPTHVVFGRKGLFVSDSGNHRVLCWKTLPEQNGQAADIVIGQPNFNANRPNRDATPAAITFNDPFGLFLEEDLENEEDPGLLYVVDRANSRVVVWKELPEQAHEQELPEDVESVDYEQEQLMGYDDDYMDEEDKHEKEPDKNLPVA